MICPLFAAVAARSDPKVTTAEPPPPSAVEEALKALNPDSLTPREALEHLYRLKEML